MIITEKGHYRFLQDWSSRGPIGIAVFTAGTVLEITQIDKKNKHVIGPELLDWADWDLPVEKVE